MTAKQQLLNGKYQIKPNIFVDCLLNIIEATAQNVRVQVGIHTAGDTEVPPGTKLFLPSQKATGSFDILSIDAQSHEKQYGRHVMICSPIHKETRAEQRKTERVTTDFAIQIQESEGLNFKVFEGSLDGLGVSFEASKLFIGLMLDNEYTLEAHYKSEQITFPGKIIHMHYNWHTRQHRMGIQILEMTHQREIILERLLNPNLNLEIKQKATIDTEEARIRPDM